MLKNKIAIIGCGNLGLSILNGLLDKKSIPSKDIILTRRNLESISHLSEKGITITADNKFAVKNSDIIILALKPYTILEVLNEIREVIDPKRHIVISLASSIGLDEIENTLKLPVKLYRAMPNTAAEVSMSLTCISTRVKNKKTTQIVTDLFNSVGETLVIDEDLMDAATILGACGIAYALRYMRAMIQGGIEIGFDAKTANFIVKNTVKGAAELLIKRNMHPEHEIDKVTTPKGCTIVGLNEMEHNGFSSALIKGLVSSFEKIEK